MVIDTEKRTDKRQEGFYSLQVSARVVVVTSVGSFTFKLQSLTILAGCGCGPKVEPPVIVG